ncbi:FMN-binding protein [Streptomyces niger]|uniref:FMN-binding protein n=1 Tax=Streptomyces niger TaxID=66373 RepID=UPI00069B25AB|nr:FMN-binding protein [Streptomyces niger]
MRRAAVTTLTSVAGIVLLLSLKPHQATAPPVAPAPSAAPAPSSAGGTGTATAPTRTSGSNGTFTGDVVNTRYGPVQVAATLKGGRITAVKVLQVPSANGRDQQLAGYAVPQLTRAALTAQSAHIDAVSGASYTSEGYIQSLQSALDRAHA